MYYAESMLLLCVRPKPWLPSQNANTKAVIVTLWAKDVSFRKPVRNLLKKNVSLLAEEFKHINQNGCK